MLNSQPTIKRTLIVRISLLIVLINALVGFSFYLFSKNLAEMEFEQQRRVQIKHLSDTFAQQLWLFDLVTTEKLAQLALETSDIMGIRLKDHTDKIVVEEGVFEGDIEKYISQSLSYGNDKVFVGSIEVAFVDASWNKHRWYAWFVGFISVALTLLTTIGAVSYLLTRHLSRPLDKLQYDMEQLAEGEFIQSGLAGRKEEVQRIVDKFNQMVEALKEREWARHEAERRMLAMQERFLSLFRESRDSIFTATLEGRLVDINPAMLELLGYSEGEIPGITISDIFRSNEPDRPVMASIDEKGSVADYQVDIITKSGAVCHCLLSGSQWRNSAGEVFGYQGIIRDITEQKMLEKQLDQARKMESIGTLAGGIAHDFNNILSILYGYTELMQLGLEDRGIESSDEMTQIIVALDRARDLVKQILAFSRQSEVERVQLQIVSLVKEIVKMLRSSIPSTITIQEHYDSTCGAVYADPVQVQQIVMNLCTNAQHAMESRGGTLSVSLQPIMFSHNEIPPAPKLQQGKYVKLIVSDTGCGIEPSKLDRIFDPYFTTKEQGKGTGMGLAIIHGIVAEYEGAITVESRVGEGSSFTVYLPQSETIKPALINEGKPVAGGSEKVLLVDDEEMLAEMAEMMLRSTGYDVTVCTSSLEALTMFHEDPEFFDIVVTDQTMPEMTGLDLARSMLKVRPDLPIVICTGYSNLVDETIAKAEGIKGFAYKPLSREEFARLVREVLDRDEF